MKNLLEELKELNNEESIEVPIDFRDKVVQNILHEPKQSKLKYIIPACSVAAVMIIAVIVGNKAPKSTDNLVDESEEITLASGAPQETYYTDDMLRTSAVAELDSALPNASEQFAVNEKKSINSSLENAEIAKEYYDEILDMLKLNNIEAEKTDNGIRAKGKKEDIEIALYYFQDNVEIKQDGDYVIIKEK